MLTSWRRCSDLAPMPTIFRKSSQRWSAGAGLGGSCSAMALFLLICQTGFHKLVGRSQTPRASSSARLKAKDLPLLSRDPGQAIGLVLPYHRMRAVITRSKHGCFGTPAPRPAGSRRLGSSFSLDEDQDGDLRISQIVPLWRTRVGATSPKERDDSEKAVCT